MVSSHFKIREKKDILEITVIPKKKKICLHTREGTEFTNHLGQGTETGLFHSIVSLKAVKT